MIGRSDNFSNSGSFSFFSGRGSPFSSFFSPAASQPSSGGTRVTFTIRQGDNGQPQITGAGTINNGNLSVNGQGVDTDEVLGADGAPVDVSEAPAEEPEAPEAPAEEPEAPEADERPLGQGDVRGTNSTTARGVVTPEGSQVEVIREETREGQRAGDGNSEGVIESGGFVLGTSGDDTLVRTSTAGAFLRGEGGNDSLTGNIGNDTFNGGTGIDTFNIGPDNGRDVIQDFDAGAGEVVNLNVEGINSLQDLLDTVTRDQGRVVFDFGSGNSLDLRGVSISDLSADNFNFNAA